MSEETTIETTGAETTGAETTAATTETTATSAAPWYASIPDENVRGLIEAKGYKGPEDVATAYYHANKLLKGATDVVSIPKADDFDSFLGLMDKMGRPAEPSAYKLDLGEGAKIDEDFAGAMGKAAHEIGMTQAQWDKFTKAYAGYSAERIGKETETSTARAEAELAEVKNAWGADWDRNVAHGQNAVKALGVSKDLIERVENAIGDSAVLQMLATIGRKMGVEDNTIVPGGESFSMSPEAARAKIEDIKLGRDPSFTEAMRNPTHPGHKDAQAKWQNWFEVGYGKKS